MTNIYARDWLELDWSEWGSLNPDGDHLDSFTTDPGLYRVRHPDYEGLVYIGETGRSVSGRVHALARGAYADEMPFRDPHTAAPTLWAIRDRNGRPLEISGATPSTATNKQSRKAREAALIAQHRREIGHSPTANFGRIIDGYRQSSYSRDGLVGGPLPDGETEANAEPGVGPLPWTDAETPRGDKWMGLDWTEFTALEDVSTAIPQTDGVYRFTHQTSADGLYYIGESTNLRSRLYRHRRNRTEPLTFSYATLPDHDAQHKRQEVETELIGAYWLATDNAPTEQF